MRHVTESEEQLMRFNGTPDAEEQPDVLWRVGFCCPTEQAARDLCRFLNVSEELFDLFQQIPEQDGKHVWLATAPDEFSAEIMQGELEQHCHATVN